MMMMIKTLKRIIYSTLLLTLMFSLSKCYYDNEEELTQNFNKPDCETAVMSYEFDIKNIIESNCAVSGCHVAPINQNGLDLSQFADVKLIAENGSLVNRITGVGNIMPQSGPLPPCEIDKITAWVNQGNLNN
jgi:hypothetical protein